MPRHFVISSAVIALSALAACQELAALAPDAMTICVTVGVNEYCSNAIATNGTFSSPSPIAW